MKYSVLSAAAVSLILVASEAPGSIVAFNTFAADNSYGISGTWQGPSPPYEVMLAQRFDLSAAGRVELIELGMILSPGSQNPNVITLSIVPDVSGKPGESALWQATYTGLLPVGVYGPIATFPVSNGPELDRSTLYWLTTMAPPSGFRPQSWFGSSTTNSIGQRAIKYLHGGGVFPENVWNIEYPTLSVDSRTLRITVVPEPVTISLLPIIGVIAFCWNLNRQSRRRR